MESHLHKVTSLVAREQRLVTGSRARALSTHHHCPSLHAQSRKQCWDTCMLTFGDQATCKCHCLPFLKGLFFFFFFCARGVCDGLLV